MHHAVFHRNNLRHRIKHAQAGQDMLPHLPSLEGKLRLFADHPVGVSLPEFKQTHAKSDLT